MQVAAAELLGRDRLAGRGFDQRRAAEEDRALALDDDRLVGHRRDIGAAGGAGAHHHRDLGDALRRHARLIVEDAAEMVAVGEDLGLVRQVGAAGIDEIDAGQTVLFGDLLRAQMLLDRHRIIGAALDGRIVGDDHRLAPFDAADPRHHAGAVHVAFVHAEGGERADLEERRAGIEQPRHALARGELAARDMALARLGRAALGGGGAAVGEFVEQRAPGGAVGGVGRGVRARRASDRGHDVPTLGAAAESLSTPQRVTRRRLAGRRRSRPRVVDLGVVDMAHAVLVEAEDVDDIRGPDGRPEPRKCIARARSCAAVSSNPLMLTTN